MIFELGCGDRYASRGQSRRRRKQAIRARISRNHELDLRPDSFVAFLEEQLDGAWCAAFKIVWRNGIGQAMPPEEEEELEMKLRKDIQESVEKIHDPGNLRRIERQVEIAINSEKQEKSNQADDE